VRFLPPPPILVRALNEPFEYLLGIEKPAAGPRIERIWVRFLGDGQALLGPAAKNVFMEWENLSEFVAVAKHFGFLGGGCNPSPAPATRRVAC
jgi:hypothetical protein